MGYMVMGCIAMAYVIVTYTVMTYVVMADIVTAYIDMAYIVVADIVMAQDRGGPVARAGACSRAACRRVRRLGRRCPFRLAASGTSGTSSTFSLGSPPASARTDM